MTAPHFARTAPFGELADLLAAEVDRGAVCVRRCAARPALALYVYSQRATYESLWNPVVEAARGLVLDHAARRVVATPFPKFFNLGEHGRRPPEGEAFEAFEKLDGSLGVLAHDGERWRVTTKGGFESPQALWAERWLSSRDLGALTVGATYLFEIVYPENRVVVPYAWSGLAMLGAYGEDGLELARDDVDAAAASLGARTCERFDFGSLDALVDAARSFRSDREGFVVRFASGLRFKVKGAEYLRVHRLVSRVTPLALWEAMAAGDDLEAIRREIPEEFYGDFDAIRAALDARLAAVVAAVEEAHARWVDASDRDVGIARDAIPEAARPFIFLRRKGGPSWLDGARERLAVCKTFRPTNNALPGYAPTGAMRRFAEAP